MTSRKCQFGGAKVKLGDVLIQTFSGEWGSEEGDHLTPVLRTSNFNDDGTFDYASPAWRCIPEKKVVSKRLYRGDIVLEKSGGTPKRPVGIMSYYDSDQLALCSNFNQVLRVNSELMHPKYAFFQLRWLKQHNAFERYTRKTTGLQNIQMKKFVNLMILCPEISIQQEVVEQLEAISRQIKNIEYISSRLETLVKSRFVEMFGNCSVDEIRLGDTCWVGSSKRIFAKEYAESGVPFYRTKEIVELGKGQTPTTELFISEERFLQIKEKNKIPVKGDLLISAVGTIGEIWVVDTDESFYFKDGNLLWIRPGEQYEPIFLSYALKSMLETENLKLASGSAYRAMTIEKMKEQVMPVPPLADQACFVSLAKQADKLRQAA